MIKRFNWVSGLVILFILFSGWKVEHNDWFLLTSKKFGFAVKFPTKPTKDSTMVNTSLGESKMTVFLLDNSKSKTADNLLYLASNGKIPILPSGIKNPVALDKYYRKSVDGMIDKVQGTLIDEHAITIDSLKAIEVRVNFQSGLDVITVREILKGNELYLLETITKTSHDPNPSIQKFFNSFELLK